MERFDQIDFISKLISFSPRQLEGELRAGKYIQETLASVGVSFELHEFTTLIPSVTESVLLVDGERIECESCSFKGGEIIGKAKMLSSLISSQILQDEPNINFNPACEVISQSNFYFAPSVAIARRDVSRVLAGEDVKGLVRIEENEHKTANILAGNCLDPEFVCFAHYDSLKRGATDNASGVAVCMKLLLSERELLGKGLFVFSANEEISFDKPVYWGHGFREFEKAYPEILSGAKNIAVVDSVGNTAPILYRDKETVSLSFPIGGLDKVIDKVTVIAGEVDRLMRVYHSDDDDIDELTEENLDLATEALREAIV